MGRTNIDIDNNLLKQAGRLIHLKTKKQIVHKALEELVKNKKRKSILDFEGKIHWEGNLASMRRGKKWS